MFNGSTSFIVAGAAGGATLTAASAPSPLYPVYQRLWGFSTFELTAIFAVYVFAVLAALLTVGSLSDQVGRRPVASAALVLLAMGMLLFAFAGGPGGLVVARVVQGLSVGTATGTTTAMIIDAAPSPRSGSTLSSAAPPLGIALGSVLAGALVQFAPYPRQLVFWILGGTYVVLAVLVWWIPDGARSGTATIRSVARSLRPSAGLPATVRPVFVVLIPLFAATWALSGLYLSLGSSILRLVFDVDDTLIVGAVLGAFFVAGVAGTMISPLIPQPLRRGLSCGALAGGVVFTIVALLTRELSAYAGGSVVAGFGFGASFQLAVGALSKATQHGQRGQVFATMYFLSYVAFSVPALAAGLAVERFGLRPTAIAYAALDIALVLVAVLAGKLRTRQEGDEDGRWSGASTG